MNNQPQPNRHEDERRVLIEWVKDSPVRSCKIVKTKGKVILGKHYHEHKDETFYLLQGKGICTLSGKRVFRTWLFEGEMVFVPKGVIHTFELWPDTVLLGAGSLPYDPNDEISVA